MGLEHPSIGINSGLGGPGTKTQWIPHANYILNKG